MDFHSPGQGLMPASFKVRTVPLDGDDSATEEVLDPDFGEAVIVRVAPVDAGPCEVLSGSYSGMFASKTKLTAPFSPHIKSKRRRAQVRIQLFHEQADRKLSHLKFRCQKIDGITEISSEDGNGAWRKEHSSVKNQLLHEDAFQKSLGVDEAKQARRDKKGFCIEDEALNLLYESVVYYCGTPVGTIAAKDLTDGNTLNYDQVFIRDFIPSGIAFLLKGDYDIVRNFILHTLQLQRSINEAATAWGLKCLRYEIRDISPPPGVKAAMEMQAEAERRKCAQVLDSEGERQSNINIADGKKSSVILESEAAMMDQVNRAKGSYSQVTH